MKLPVMRKITKNFLTIRMKVTLWYALFMMILNAISLIFIIEMSGRSLTANQKEYLVEIVRDGIKDMNNQHDFGYLDGGVYLMLYDENKTFKEGIVPDKFTVSQPLFNNKIQTVKTENLNYYVYDQEFKLSGRNCWMRGIVPETLTDPVLTAIIILLPSVLPGFVILTCVTGYFITKRAFRPVKKIQETAQSIADGDELTLRIGLPEGKDEIARLGQTIDFMLDKLQRSFEKEKQFTSDVSHELRTPLAVVLTESEYALQHAQSLVEAKESFVVIHQQADLMTKIINQLLFFARADRAALKLRNESFSVSTVIHELVRDFRLLTELDNINIQVTDNLGRDLYYTADKVLFVRSLSNLIQNAIKYADNINVIVSEKDNYLEIAVKDDGIGIAPEFVENIWDRFFQVEESRNKKSSNSIGLGLPMVKTIVETYGGHVAIKSERTKGSTFTLYYPLKL